MSDKKSEEMALFKYKIIAEVLNNTGRGQMKYFRKMAKNRARVGNCQSKYPGT